MLQNSMTHLDGFQTTDSFRFDRHRSSSFVSLSSSSGYGSRLSLSPNDQALSHRRSCLTKYLKHKLSKHKSLVSLLLLSSPAASTQVSTRDDQQHTDIYEDVWNLDVQIERLRSQVSEETIPDDRQSLVSMSVDAATEQQTHHTSTKISSSDEELLSAAPWYQEGLPRDICEEYLTADHQSIGAFILRRSSTYRRCPFVLSVRTRLSLVEHFLIERTDDHRAYRLQGSWKVFDNLSALVVHQTVIRDILPVPLVLPSVHSTSTPSSDLNPALRSSSGVRSVRF